MSSDHLDWNGQISNDASYVLLDPGVYTFRVTKLDKTTSNTSGAPMAVVTLLAHSDKGKSNITDYLVLTRSSEWKLCSFFRALGLKKHGEAFTMDWDAVEDCTGRAEVIVDEYTKQDGTPAARNKVKQYLDKEESAEASMEEIPF